MNVNTYLVLFRDGKRPYPFLLKITNFLMYFHSPNGSLGIQYPIFKSNDPK